MKVLNFIIYRARHYNKLGRSVRLNLLDVQQAAPFARSGVDDVLAITLFLGLSTLQSLDVQFRIGNYAAAMLIAFPAAAFLFIFSMISIHRHLVLIRTEYADELNRRIASASGELAPEPIQKLELLMQHRDQVRNILTWPVDWTIYSRLAFYAILPTIAWLGAAFVEFGAGRILGDR